MIKCNLFIFFIFICCTNIAFAQQQHTWHDYQEIGLLDNCSAAAINSAVICGGTRGIDVQGYNSITFSFFYDYSAGTGWQFYLEQCYEGQAATDCTDATDWHRVGGQQVTTTKIGLLDIPYKREGLSADDYYTYTITINYKRIRLAGFQALGSPDANDKITVHARAVLVNSL